MSGSRNRGNERFYISPAVRRHQQQLMMQRERELNFLQYHQLQHQQQQVHVMMMRQFEEQQRLIQQQQQQAQIQEQQMRLRREIRAQPAAEEMRSELVESTLVENSQMIRTNIDRLVETVTPCVPVRYLPEPRRNGQEVHEAGGLIQFYNLDDLWESYREWSAYGAGVDVKLKGNQNVTQYYVPSLSSIQLYVDPATARPVIDTISQRMSLMSIAPGSSTGESSHSRGRLIFEYQEHEPPHLRKPLFDMISALAIGFSDLKKYRSCDLLPSSWISVAWYPIYRIPTGPSLKTLEASFLTFHHLATPPTSDRNIVGAKASHKMNLPVFGLASYKLGSPILPLLDSEQRLSDSLFESAKNWIEHLDVYHPDYNFFLRNGKSLES
ncbi:hypothetical protein QQ045_029162 [Rhodiola kirilowii]